MKKGSKENIMQILLVQFNAGFECFSTHCAKNGTSILCFVGLD